MKNSWRFPEYQITEYNGKENLLYTLFQFHTLSRVDHS